VNQSSSELVVRFAYLSEPVARAVHRTAPHATEMDELKSLANLGLAIAADRWPAYCAENGYSPEALEYFVAFAKRRMRGAVLDSLRAGDWARRTLRTASKQLIEAGCDRGLSEDVLAKRTGMSVQEVRSTLAAIANKPVSFDADETLDVPALQTVEQTAFEEEVTTALVAGVEDLSPPERVVLVLHYFVGLEMQEIADLVGVTESRASHFHTSAVLSIHDSMRSIAAVKAS
jgi:RNA polymerase sigma factor for flagellar operon FliA